MVLQNGIYGNADESYPACSVLHGVKAYTELAKYLLYNNRSTFKMFYCFFFFDFPEPET